MGTRSQCGHGYLLGGDSLVEGGGGDAAGEAWGDEGDDAAGKAWGDGGRAVVRG